VAERDGETGFWLYDLRVETVLDGRTPVCRHVEGESFAVEGEALVFDRGQRVSMYALAAVLPLLPAKQRPTDEEDWMSTDAEVACPDPHCGGRFRITRTAKRWVHPCRDHRPAGRAGDAPGGRRRGMSRSDGGRAARHG
jgi:TIGR04076 family protein